MRYFEFMQSSLNVPWVHSRNIPSIGWVTSRTYICGPQRLYLWMLILANHKWTLSAFDSHRSESMCASRCQCPLTLQPLHWRMTRVLGSGGDSDRRHACYSIYIAQEEHLKAPDPNATLVVPSSDKYAMIRTCRSVSSIVCEPSMLTRCPCLPVELI